MGRRTDEPDDKLKDAVRSRGYQPARAEVEHLFTRLAGGDRDEALLAERALARLPDAAELAMARFSASRPPERGRLCKLIGRVAQVRPSGARTTFLLERLDDPDAKTRRNAVIALGKLDDARIEPALLALWAREPSVELQRSLAAALGKMGGEGALELLRAVTTDDAELRRITDEALLKLERTGARQVEAGGIDAKARPLRPIAVRLHCRWGLAQLVTGELDAELGARVVDDETVSARLTGPLERLWQSRIALRFGFPLPTGGARDPGDAVVRALTSDEALAIVRAFTRGPVRYRIEWSEAGHRRGLTFRVAREVAAKRPELLNDPTASLWEVVVREVGGVSVELWPRGLDDPRFAYRQAHVPASSHPTLAAALARVGGVQPDDVVWDPFVGAGTELVERARLGRYKRALGTDLDPAALERARKNLAAAGVRDVELAVADARSFRPPEQPTLVVTNPPLGRRVLNKQLTGALYDAVLDHVASLLPPGGRLVWITTRARDAVERARANGLRLDYKQRVDMGGFWAELQRFTSSSRRRGPR
jgi:23S rRNA G2445 N2-methylase RlmL